MEIFVPELRSKIGSTGTVTMPPDGEVFTFTIVDEIRRVQSNSDGTKVLTLQRLRFDNENDELRFGYYIIGKKEHSKGKWVWGQFCPIAPAPDFFEIFEEARQKGWFISV